MTYYYITHYYHNNERPRISGHVIKAENEQKALHISLKLCLKYHIPHKSKIEETDNTWLLERRRKGHGGYIWYEENGKLKKETE